MRVLRSRQSKHVSSKAHTHLLQHYYRPSFDCGLRNDNLVSSQIRPGSAAGEGLKGGAKHTEESGDDSEDDEPRKEVKEESNEEALAR